MIVLSHSTRHYDVHSAGDIVKEIEDKGYSLESLDTGLDRAEYWHERASDKRTFGGTKYVSNSK